jgi:hypothetical protein
MQYKQSQYEGQLIVFICVHTEGKAGANGDVDQQHEAVIHQSTDVHALAAEAVQDVTKREEDGGLYRNGGLVSLRELAHELVK